MRWRVVSLVVVLSFVGVWGLVQGLAHRAMVDVSCPSGARPTEISFFSVVGIGHGAFGGTLTLREGPGDQVTVTRQVMWTPGSADQREALERADAERLLWRLTRSHAHLDGPGEVVLTVSVTCGAETREREFREALSRSSACQLLVPGTWATCPQQVVAPLVPEQRRISTALAVAAELFPQFTP